jgi:hypothetical protein
MGTESSFPPPHAPPALPNSVLTRRQVVQLLGLGLVAAGGGYVALRPRPPPEGDSLLLVSPEHTGPLPAHVLQVLIATGRLVSRHLGFAHHADEGTLEGHLRNKCAEAPSYLGTYVRYASSEELPAELSVEWLGGLQELYRRKVVGEIAIMLLISGGFRAFGYNNFNGYMGGSWHNPQESGSFRPSSKP